jgi:Fanconi anemia group M protein
VSSLPERHGCDIVSITKRGLVGYQRKTLPDLQSSLLDGRLYLELSQLQSSGGISYAYLIIESPLARTTEGTLLESTLTIDQVRSIIVKFAASGVSYLPTASVSDTAQAILNVGRYIQSDSFDSVRRPKQLTNAWGTIDSNAYALWLLQSFPGIGPKNAAAIHDHFGTVPIAWTVTASELQAIPGIGKKMAETLINSLASDRRPPKS